MPKEYYDIERKGKKNRILKGKKKIFEYCKNPGIKIWQNKNLQFTISGITYKLRDMQILVKCC